MFSWLELRNPTITLHDIDPLRLDAVEHMARLLSKAANAIPSKYGIHQVIGDTLGIGGISRAARAIPAVVGFAREMEKRCPDALMLNYSNPMSMVTWGVYAATKIKVVGLCHSMYWTTKQLTEYIGAPFSEITFDGAGVNQQAWLLRFERNGQDACPAL